MPGFLTGPLNGFVDRMKGRGMCSSGFLQQIGQSTAQSTGGGLIGFQSSVAGTGNAADATADTLYQAIIPARFFDVPGRQLYLEASGTVSASSATKTVAFVWGGGSLNQSIVVYTTTNTGTWQFAVTIWKISANVQGALFAADASGTTSTLLGLASGTRSLVQNVGGSETDTAAITMKITGTCSSSVAGVVNCMQASLFGYN